MRLKKSKLLLILIVALAGGLLVFFVIFTGPWLNKGYENVQKFRLGVFSKLNIFSSFISEINKIKNLTQENIFLKEENRKLLSQLAMQTEYSDHEKFLGELVGLDILNNHQFVDARIFNIQFGPDGHYFLINLGEDAEIEKGDIIISSSGVLIGQIVEIYKNYSRAELITNPNFKATLRIMGKETIGIAKGNLGDGLLLDFISQNDEISVSDTVVTNGNDFFPPGLIIGTISEINSDDANIFKKVEIKPEFHNIKLDRVLILKN